MFDPSFFPQCCDAISYLEQGRQCAAGDCVSALRPAGALFWFSIPFRLGLSPDVLVYAHWLLLLLSVVMSVLSLVTVLRHRLAFSGLRSFLLIAAPVAISSMIAHAVAFQPVMFVALSDAPASVLVLLAVWCLLLGRYSKPWVFYGSAGLLLGLAVQLRAFYLYPVLLALGAGLFAWWFFKPRSWAFLALFIALLPIALQCGLVRQKYNVWAFLPDSGTNEIKGYHLGSSLAGYDTLLPAQPYYWWYPASWAQDCEPALGLAGAIQARHWQAGACLLVKRWYFYWGSYSPLTYVTAGMPENRFSLAGDAGHPYWWGLEGLQHEMDVAKAPDGSMTADRFVIDPVDPDGAGRMYFWSESAHPANHQFRVWLWAGRECTIDAVLFRYADNRVVQRETLLLATQPKEFVLTVTPLDVSGHGISLGRFDDKTVSCGSLPGDALYAWKANLAEDPVAVTAHEVTPSGAVRYWSPVMLAGSGILFLCALCWLLWQWRALGASGPVVLALWMGIQAQALMIIPE